MWEGGGVMGSMVYYLDIWGFNVVTNVQTMGGCVCVGGGGGRTPPSSISADLGIFH